MQNSDDILRLSNHDLAGVGVGTTISEALAGSTAQTVLADKLGYHRYWVAEHHGTPSVASSAPIVVLTHLAANTRTTQTGSLLGSRTTTAVVVDRRRP